MILAGRNQHGLSSEQIGHCVLAWEALCGEQLRELVITEATAHSSRTRFNETDGKVYLGADALPGAGVEANARLSMPACLAHELAHAERYEIGFRRPLAWPHILLDEAETSLHAAFHQLLTPRERADLVEDARERLIEWLAQQQQRIEP